MAAIIRSFNQRREDWRYSWLGVFIHAACEPALFVAKCLVLLLLWDDLWPLLRLLVFVGICCVSMSFVKTIVCFGYRLEEHAERLDLAEDYFSAMNDLEDQLAAGVE
ncbi:hypothetical protein AB0H71_16555 [Nocardia sp. NPDC050697]|uniref:hypothetical protein n=1 Tax=Nocardia sp. NPDC050697 TaxID=3155158 RepID=UPI0033CBBDA0